MTHLPDHRAQGFLFQPSDRLLWGAERAEWYCFSKDLEHWNGFSFIVKGFLLAHAPAEAQYEYVYICVWGIYIICHIWGVMFPFSFSVSEKGKQPGEVRKGRGKKLLSLPLAPGCVQLSEPGGSVI